MALIGFSYINTREQIGRLFQRIFGLFFHFVVARDARCASQRVVRGPSRYALLFEVG